MNRELRIAMVGAGQANFGSGEGPWDHATRLEQIEGLRMVAVVDPDVECARRALAHRHGPLYEKTRVFADYRAMLAEAKPDAAWIAVPPNTHGTLAVGHTMERDLAESGVHLFLEKPLSSARPEDVRPLVECLRMVGTITSVGYMFRYGRAVARIREILEEHGGHVFAFAARYNCAYSEIRKREWWDTRFTGGPIIEQATHFLDLARHLVGEVDLPSVRAVAIRSESPLNELSRVPHDAEDRSLEEGIPATRRIPRSTAAVWRFRNDAIGSLHHAVLLHGRKYETEIELWGDGVCIVWRDPYGANRLLVRRPGTEELREIEVPATDPYLEENRAFVEAVRTGDRSLIRCPFDDAYGTHAFAWAIVDAASGRAVRSPEATP